MSKIRAEVRFGLYGKFANMQLDDWQKTANPWTVTLLNGRRRMTVPYFTGSAITHEPTAADVVNCLALDAQGASTDFATWCDDYGYSTDSRKAEATFKQIERNSRALDRLLGNDYDVSDLTDEGAAAAACQEA